LAELPTAAASAAQDAWLAAACLAIAPADVGGILARTDFDEPCYLWLGGLRALLEPELAVRRMPAHIDEEGLAGGIDLAATLRHGRTVYTRGLLAESAGGVIVLSGAERLAPRTAAMVAAALAGPIRFGVVALDGAVREDEHCPPGLAARLGMHVELRGICSAELARVPFQRTDIARGRTRYARVAADPEAIRALCAAAAACGIDSLQAPILALKVARASAALDGRTVLTPADLGNAARLVLAARARVRPAPPAPEAADTPPEPPPEQQDAAPAEAQREQPLRADELEEQVLDAVRASIPAQLLASLAAGERTLSRSSTAGKVGAMVSHGRRGRPAGVRAGRPRRGTKLNIVATLRAAAPWQRLRRQGAAAQSRGPGRRVGAGRRVLVRAEDFRVTRYRQRSETATLFVLDASGSSALHRLAEVKGAVELLLAECYVRRDQVAVVAFRGRGAELLLPPTRSLVRAKRALAGLPGGGGTPLASGLDAARELAEQLRRRGLVPALVVLTDGQANVARDGTGGRQRAGEEALHAARALQAGGFRALLIDTAPRPQPQARALADAMRARYLPLPHADARALAGAVQSQ